MQRSLPLIVASLSALSLFLPTPNAFAHYLWVAVDDAGEHGTIHVYFEEVPTPRDGGYLDPFVKHGKTWIRALADGKRQEVAMQETKQKDKRWLSAPAPVGGPRSIDSYGKFGVYRYGQTDVLLHYYARELDVSDHDELHELGRAEEMALDIVPHEWNGKLEATVYWQGKPAAKRPFYVRGPQGFKATLETDDKGKVSFAPEAKGRYLLRTYTEEEQGGVDDGKDYVKIRHNATMTLNWPFGE